MKLRYGGSLSRRVLFIGANMASNSHDTKFEASGVKSPITFSKKAWTAVGIATAVFVSSFLIWIALKEILVIFAGILLAVFLHGISNFVSSRTFVPRKVSLFLIIGAFIALILVGSMRVIPELVDQSDQLVMEISTSTDKIQGALSQSSIGQTTMDQISNLRSLSENSGSIISRASTIFSNTIDVFIRTVIILFVGFYLALEPSIYLRGIEKLVKPGKRTHFRDAVNKAGYALRWWLAGRLASMVVVAILSIAGLMLLDVPLAMILGVLAGLLAFIPFLGPTLALIPPMLIAFTESPQKALYVFLLYMGIQFVESYLITPIIQRRATSLPPVLLIGSQVLMGLLAGLWGVMLAAPLAVVATVAVKKFYIEDILGDHSVNYLKDERENAADGKSDSSDKTQKKTIPTEQSL